MEMKIDHLAIWVEDLEKMRSFYQKYFDAISGEKYYNPKKEFTSYFLLFEEGKTRIELMHKPSISKLNEKRGDTMGLAHFAISVGGKEEVDALTERLLADNYIVQSEPRTTGDGYYESVVLDPEGNTIEITL